MGNLIITTIIKNAKSQSWFYDWLNNAQTYSDLHIIVDNYSDDGTFEDLKTHCDKDKTKIYQSDIDFTTNEHSLRRFLWDCTREHAKEGDWIFVLDSDELISNELGEFLQNNLEKVEKDVIRMRLFDTYKDAGQYRIDGYWSPYITRLFKYQDYNFSPSVQAGLHKSPLPSYVQDLEFELIENGIIHLSYSLDELIEKKYKYYSEKISPMDIFNYSHAQSLKANKENIHLKTFLDRKFNNNRILICSLIKDRGWVLPYYLECLHNSEKIEGADYSYYFIINNTTDNSEKIIKEWANNHKYRVLIDYHNWDDEHGEHEWNDTKIKHMAYMRNMCLEKAGKQACNCLISIDSDVLIHPKLLNHMILSDKHIITGVFWADWKGSGQKLPNTWIRGGYELTESFLESLKSRNIHKVMSSGACTLIRENVWSKGVKYNQLYSLPSDVWGEDRSFTVRAEVAGFDMYATTYYPVVHVDSKSSLERNLEEAKEKGILF